jgi:hypothetical protein
MMAYSQAERRRDTRNANPIAPARVAMAIWGDRYSAQRGGSMDFWDTLNPGDKSLCIDIAERIKEAPMEEER